MKRGSTLFLRAVIAAIGIGALALCLFVLPVGIRAEDVDGYRPILLGMYIPVLPFIFALIQGIKLLGYIDQGKAFSDLSVRALNSIKYCAIIIAGFYVAGMPYVYLVADKDDAPGVIVIGLIIIFAALVVSTFAAVLEKVLRDAIDIKSENDLTV